MDAYTVTVHSSFTVRVHYYVLCFLVIFSEVGYKFIIRTSIKLASIEDILWKWQTLFSLFIDVMYILKLCYTQLVLVYNIGSIVSSGTRKSLQCLRHKNSHRNFSVRYSSPTLHCSTRKKNFLTKMFVCKLLRSNGNIGSEQMSNWTIRSFCVASLATRTDRADATSDCTVLFKSKRNILIYQPN